MNTEEPSYLDGNAAAGELRALFAVELTAAQCACAGCGRLMRLAEARIYGPAPGLVLRCPGCEGVLLRLVTTADRSWLDMRGLTYVETSA